MPLHLKIENQISLPDGGPIAITVSAKRGIDIGRDQYLDWVLPDPTRFVSGKHCEIRFRDGAFRLIDVSTNGTFVNGGEFRLGGPHALKSGDRIDIGPYIISVLVEPESQDGDGGYAGSAEAVPINEVWDAPEAAPPVDPRLLKEPSVRRGIGSADILDWISDIPTPVRSAPRLEPERQESRSPESRSPELRSPGSPMSESARPEPARPERANGAAPSGTPIRWDLTKQPFGEAPPSGDAPGFPAAPDPPAGLDRAMPSALPTERLELAPDPPETPPPRTPPPKLPQATPLAVPARAAAADDAEFIRRFAKGLGLHESAVARRSAGDLAEELGAFVRATADHLKQLESARAQSKGAMRSANPTMVKALDNNPLKFAPTTDDALRILFGPPTTSYLDARRTLDSSFTDIKKHQALVFSAMQTALRQLLEDLDPDRIEAAAPAANGVAALLKSRPGELWARYQLTWKAKAGRSEHKMLDAFMRLFAEAYDAASK